MRSGEKKGCFRKRNLWKGLSLLLVLAAVMSGSVSYASGSGILMEPEAPSVQETQTESGSDEAAFFDFDPGTEEEFGTIEEITYVNPLYADIIRPSELDRSEGIAPYADYELCSSMKQAGELVRKRMKERTGTFTFQMPFKGTAPGNFLTTVLDQAMEHTGKSTEGDYLRWQYGGVRLSGSYYGTGNGNYLYTWTFTFTYYTTRAQEEEMDKLVKKTLASLDLGNASEYAKVEGIYQYICSTVKYDYANLNNASHKLKFTAYAALKNKTAVCQGYALLFYRLALELGVDARFISGLGNGGAHGWNIVKVNGRYYNLDATWDAEYYRVLKRYEYFLKSDRNFTDHKRDTRYADKGFYGAYPMATSDFSRQLFNSAQDGWKQVNGEWYYYENSKAQTGWKQIKKLWYYMDSKGVMQTGWKKIGNKWYYLSGDGAMQTGWLKLGNTWYYLNGSGAMQTGWLKLGNTWYYLNGSGAMQTGWLKLGNTWYYLNGSGAMQTGWLKLGSTWYYLRGNGAMVNSDTLINGVINQFDHSGAWLGTRAS